jgi:RimJ/RimL family protein N-acetyltransferase
MIIAIRPVTLDDAEAFMRLNLALDVGLHRLELMVMTHNAAAVALYRKMGFQVEGTHTHALCVDGRYVDEYCMAKLLGDAQFSPPR